MSEREDRLRERYNAIQNDLGEALIMCGEALRAIIIRSHNGDLGTSKVIDMRNIAQEALSKITNYPDDAPPTS